MYKDHIFFTFLPTRYCLLDYSNPGAYKWYFTVALIYITLVTKDVEHLMCLLTICMSSLENITF